MKAIMDWIKANWKWIAGIIILILIAVAVLTFKGCNDKPNANLQSIENSLTAANGTINGLNITLDKLGSGFDKIDALLGLTRDSLRELRELVLNTKPDTAFIDKLVLSVLTDTIIQDVYYPDVTEVSGTATILRTAESPDTTIHWTDKFAVKSSIAGIKLRLESTTIKIPYWNVSQNIADLEWWIRGGIALVFFILGVAI